MKRITMFFAVSSLILLLLLSFFSISLSQETTGTVTDIDGNAYKTIKIGDQWWMAKNLKTTHFQNGDPIPNVKTNADWIVLTSAACCVHENDDKNAAVYGYLYNWFAVSDKRNIAPKGWRVATDEDWKILEMTLGMSQADADNKRARGTNEGSKLAGNADLWADKDVIESDGAFGKSGFDALPAGSREKGFGNFTYTGTSAYFWTSTESDEKDAWCRRLNAKRADIFRNDVDKPNGFSVRCVKDTPNEMKKAEKATVLETYVQEDKPTAFIEFFSDGTFCLSDGDNKMNGTYVKTSDVITVNLGNGQSVSLKLDDDVLTGPTGKRMLKK